MAWLRWDIFAVATFIKSWNTNLSWGKDQILDCGWELNWREVAFWGKSISSPPPSWGQSSNLGGPKQILTCTKYHLKSLFRELTKWRKFEEPVACHVYLTLGMADHLLLWQVGWLLHHETLSRPTSRLIQGIQEVNFGISVQHVGTPWNT